MTYLQQKSEDFFNALNALQKGLLDHPDELQRDGAIQRFEFCFELAWKMIRLVAESQGLEGYSSPKKAIQVAFQQSWIEDEALWLQMLSDRNLATHTYRKALAEQLFSRLPAYHAAMLTLYHHLIEQSG